MISKEHTEAISKYFRPKVRPKDGVFYAHELGSELLVNYLARTSEPNDVRLNMETLNDSIKQLFPTIRLSIMLENNWTIRAKIPVLNQDTNSLYLPVVLSTNRIVELSKAIKSDSFHPLIAELSFAGRHYDSDVKLFIVAIDRLYTDYRKMPTEAWNLLEVKPMDGNAVLDIYTERTNELQRHLSDKTEPSRCENIRWHKAGGKVRNMTCMYYCNHSDSCKQFSSYSKSKHIQNDIIF